jgi:hypothetical protein
MPGRATAGSAATRTCSAARSDAERARGVAHDLPQGAPLGLPAPGEQAEHACPGGDAKVAAGRGPLGAGGVQQRVADEGRGHPARREERLLERQDDCGVRHHAPVSPEAPRAPRPELRGDVLEHRHLPAMGQRRHPPVESGVIDEHRHPVRPAFQLAGDGPQPGEMDRDAARRLDEAHGSEARQVADELHSGRGHQRAADAAQPDVGPGCAHRQGEGRRVGVARGLPGGQEDVQPAPPTSTPRAEASTKARSRSTSGTTGAARRSSSRAAAVGRSELNSRR